MSMLLRLVGHTLRRVDRSLAFPFRWLSKRPKLGLSLVCNQSSRFKNSKQRWAFYAGLLATLGLEKEDRGRSAEQLIIDNIKAAILAHKRGNLNVAERLLHLALKIAQEQQHAEAITYVYDAMANMALERGDLEKAERLFKAVVQHLVSSGSREDDDAVLEISIKLAGIYERLGKSAEAESGYSHCLRHLGRKVSAESSPTEDTVLLWAMCADAYGRHLSNQNKFLEASDYFSKALEACRRILGPKHPQTLVVLNNLGSAYGMSGNYGDAIQHLKLAVDIAREIGSEDLAAYCCNLGMLYLEMAKITEAEFYCKRALATSPEEGTLRKEALGCLKSIQKSKQQQPQK